MKFNRMTRRMFLQGSGGAFLAMPLLTSLLPRELQAQSSAPIKRFISVISGYEPGHNAVWLPHAAGTDLNLAQPNRVMNVGNGHHPIRWQPLREFAPTNSSFLTTLNGTGFSPYLESMNIMRSLHFTSRYGHAAGHVLGGIEASTDLNPARGALRIVPTADFVLNNNRTFNPAGLPLVNCIDDYNITGGTAYSYSTIGGVSSPSTGVNTELSSLYNRLFANGTLPENGATNVAHPKFNILTRVLEDYTRVRNSRNISANDRVALDNSLDKISDVQRSLNRVSTAQCSHRSLTKSGSFYYSSSNAAIGKAYADLITAGIMCDTGRVFTVGGHVLGGMFQGQADDHDTISHNPFAVFSGKPSWQILGERQAQFMRHFVLPLVQNLSAAIDPSNGRSLLYNSLIYNTYQNGTVHGWGSHPVQLFGNAGGSLTSGNYIDYADRTKGAYTGAESDGTANLFSATPGSANFSNNWYGVSYNRLMVTILQAMGLAPSDYENNSLNNQLYNRTDIGADNRNLTSIGGFGYAHMTDLSNPDGFANYIAPGISNQDLKQYRYPLALPTQS